MICVKSIWSSNNSRFVDWFVIYHTADDTRFLESPFPVRLFPGLRATVTAFGRLPRGFLVAAVTLGSMISRKSRDRDLIRLECLASADLVKDLAGFPVKLSSVLSKESVLTLGGAVEKSSSV